jgi:HK97 family phage portal protein
MGGINSLVNWLREAVGAAGEEDQRMTADRALSYPPVWYCVSKITGAFQIMPLNVHRESGRNKSIQPTHASYQLWRWRPNAFQTPAKFKQLGMAHALLWGNWRAYIRRENGVPVELIPLLPDRTETGIIDGEKWHATLIQRDDRLSLYNDMGTNREKVIYMPDVDVFHLPGLGFDGVQGKSLLSLARQSFGIGLNAEKQIANQQKKGYSGGINLEAPAGAFRSEADAREFLKLYRESHAGVDGEQIGLLREGIKASVMAMSNQDAQFIEQRRFQREDAALLFVLEGILGDSSNASFASLEQRNLQTRVNCYAPWSTAIEEECDNKLLTESERRRGFYHKFNDGALLRTEKSATASFVSQLITARVINPNEAREMFDMNPYEGGDEFANPSIDKKESGKDDENENGGGGASNQPRRGNNAAMRLTLEELIATEASRVKQATKKPQEFLAKMEQWYKGWEAKLADKIEAIGGDRELATEHCEASKERLIECVTTCKGNLSDAVSACVESWPSRANKLIEEIELCSK